MRSFLVPVLVVFVLSGCIKKTGCTDYEAMNYNSEAERSDQSCIYQADIVIYWDINEYQNHMMDSASTHLYFYLDDKLIGNAPADSYSNSGVYCYNGEGAINTVDTLYYSDPVYKQLRVIDQDGKEMYNFTTTFYQGCNLIQL